MGGFVKKGPHSRVRRRSRQIYAGRQKWADEDQSYDAMPGAAVSQRRMTGEREAGGPRRQGAA